MKLLGWLGFTLLWFLTSLLLLSHLPFLREFFPWAALAYAPDQPLLTILLVLSVSLFIFGRRKSGIASSFLAVLFALVHGDFGWPWRFSNRTLVSTGVSSDSEKNLLPFVKIQAINLRYYSFGKQRLTNFILENPSDFVLLSENTMELEHIKDVWQNIPGAQLYAGRTSETGVLSRWPVKHFREVELPTHQASLYESNTIADQVRNTHRSFVHIEADVNGHKLNVLSVRFVAGRPASDTLMDNVYWGRYLMGAQKKELDFFSDYVSRLEGPVVFGGDLNATPGSFVARRFNTLADDVWLKTHFVGLPSFSTLSPLSLIRLDFLFARGLRSVSAKILPDLVSDHWVVEGVVRF
jgi:endonuclease/exonuclease/phosphatase (EEP) superfamily protein YafD